MSTVVELIQKYRAPPIAVKLEAAQSNLQTLEGDLGQAVLDAEENAPGAAKRLTILRSQILDAERAVTEFTKAHSLATRLDKQSDAVSRAKMRESQLQAMKAHLQQRAAAMATMCQAAETLHAAYRKYLLATEKAVGVVPIGTVLPMMTLGKDGLFGPALGDAGRLLSAEFYRFTVPDADGRRGVLPFSAPPANIYRDNPGSIEPALDLIKAADAAILESIEQQLSKIEDSELAATSAAEPLQEAI